jgi:outer membrane protein insertion porin family/translocation and assembly module TamA
MGLALLSAPAAGAHAQETRCERGDVEVRSLSFTGNAAFTDAELEAGIVTTPSSWARRTLRIIGTRRCLDPRAFQDDVLRLTIFYRNQGFVNATVDTVVTSLGRARVAVRFVVTEGRPMLVDTVRVAGLDAVPERAEVLAKLPTTVGGRFDRYANRASRDSITSRLRDNGYPDAETYLGYDTRTDEMRATVEFTVDAGPRRRIGRVAIARTGRDGRPPAVTESAVRRLAGLREGELYRERLLERAKRTLYQSEAFGQVSVQPGEVAPDSTLTVDVAVTESYLRAARLGGGWGTLDCFRATGEFTEYNLFKTATRLELRSRLSKIGIGAPLDGAKNLCQTAGKDIYSGNLNYYVGATLSQPSLLRASFVPTLSLYSERRSEYNAFLRTTPVGASVALAKSLPRRTHGFAYTIEYGRTEAQPALFCAVFNACEAQDRLALQQTQRLAVISASTGYERTDNPLDPSEGRVGRVEARYASRFIGADPSLEFTRLTADGSLYFPLGTDVVLATRLRVGVVLGPTFALGGAARFVPAQERLFAGGPTTVRGYRQNELGPAVYIPTAYDTVDASGMRVGAPATAGDTVYFRANADSVGQRAVPTGGNTLVVANVEIRFAGPFLQNLLRWTLFADAGQVWNRGQGLSGLRSSAIRWTPGFGVRIKTPIGFLRADLAYNPYRRTSGAAYFDAPVASGGALYCVSPTNVLPVTMQGTGSAARLVQAEGPCPGSFRPPTGSNFFSRLTPSIAIGQAF